MKEAFFVNTQFFFFIYSFELLTVSLLKVKLVIGKKTNLWVVVGIVLENVAQFQCNLFKVIGHTFTRFVGRKYAVK